jgi:hypothetical protein
VNGRAGAYPVVRGIPYLVTVASRLATSASSEGTCRGRARFLTEFQASFPDEASCAAFLFERRWPDGFVYPACGGRRAALLGAPPRMPRLPSSDFDHG